MFSANKPTLPLAMVAAAAIIASPAAAVDYGTHYKNKTITILIPYGPGGTYDKYGQTFSRHFGRFIPGEPTVIVQHMPGAGGAKAMNYTYKAMQKNGYNMVVPLDNIVINQLMRPKKMRYKADGFTWIGSSNQTNNVLVARTDSGVTSIKSWKGKSLIGATSGKSSTGYIIPSLAMKVLGLKGRMVTGYKGSSRSIMAVEQGEAQMAAFNWLAWSSKVPHWFKGDKPFARALLQVGHFKDPALPNVPMLDELVDAKYKDAVAFLGGLGVLGRGLALPPGVPKALVPGLRASYKEMNKDPKFAAELKKRRLRLMFTDGATLQKTVKRSLSGTTPAVIKQLRTLVFGSSK